MLIHVVRSIEIKSIRIKCP